MIAAARDFGNRTTFLELGQHFVQGAAIGLAQVQAGNDFVCRGGGVPNL
jgi:hypothetical protein